MTNSNHHRAAARFAQRFPVPIFAHRETFADDQPSWLTIVADGDEISDGLRVIGIEGAASGEIVLHYAGNGGTLIVGDALVNFEPYGFSFLPAKYCSDQKQMRHSLRKLLDYRAKRILFAHGTPILSTASERLRGLLDSGICDSHVYVPISRPVASAVSREQSSDALRTAAATVLLVDYHDAGSGRTNYSLSSVDSLFAHDFRTAVCSWCAHRGREWLAFAENSFVGGRVHGLCAHRSHAFQSAG